MSNLQISNRSLSYDDFKIKNIENTLGLKYLNQNLISNFDLRNNFGEWEIGDTTTILDKNNKEISIEDLLEDKAFGDEIYNKYRCINALDNFNNSTYYLLTLVEEEKIFININSMELNKNNEVEIKYEIYDFSKDKSEIMSSNTISIRDDRNFEYVEIENDIVSNVLHSLKDVCEKKGLALKTQEDISFKDGVYCSSSSLQEFKSNEYIGNDYFVVNSGRFNIEYFGNYSSRDFKENALAFHDGRMYLHNSEFYDELCEEFKDKFSDKEINEIYTNEVFNSLEYENPFKQVNDLLEDSGLSDKLMIISRKGKDNFIVPKINSCIDANGYDCFYIEQIPTQEDINKCLNLLDDVKNSIYEEAYLNAKERLNDLLENEDKQNNKNKVFKR
ncbi:hypothetical protein [Campylobacter devanensis]|uniref:hypothetical protein n=1 Tax=Campylobacter devanensis TaxID=3161138 RepID=UPI000A33A564|nr:hypothetical protein [Campylobacter sp. P160]